MQVVDNLVINCGNAVIGVTSTNAFDLFYITGTSTYFGEPIFTNILYNIGF